jgi:hypothetical protein
MQASSVSLPSEMTLDGGRRTKGVPSTTKTMESGSLMTQLHHYWAK